MKIFVKVDVWQENNAMHINEFYSNELLYCCFIVVSVDKQRLNLKQQHVNIPSPQMPSN